MIKMFALVTPQGTIVPESVSVTKSQCLQKANRIPNSRLFTAEEVEVRLVSDVAEPEESEATQDQGEKKKGFWGG
jgi:hypothetical protein